MKVLFVVLMMVAPVYGQGVILAGNNHNPDGIVGTMFIDVGGSLSVSGFKVTGYADSTFISDNETKTKQSLFHVSLGVPLSNDITFFASYTRPKSKTLIIEGIAAKSKDYVISANLRLYIGMKSKK